MIHFVHPWRKWLILSQKSAESISGLVVKTSELVSVSGVCQEDAAILASCRNYFLQRPTNRDINKSGHFQIVSVASNKSGHFQIVYRCVLAFVVTLTIASKRKAQRSWVHQRHGSEPLFFCRIQILFSNVHLRIFNSWLRPFSYWRNTVKA